MIKKLLLCVVLLTLSAGFVWADNLQLAEGTKFIEPVLESVLLDARDEILYPSPGGRQEDTIIIDDGTLQWWCTNGSAGWKEAVKLTPTGPCTLIAVLYIPHTASALLNWGVWDDNGSGGIPGTKVASGSLTPTLDAFYRVNLPTPVYFADGSFYAGWEDIATPFMAMGGDTQLNGFNWWYNGSSWVLDSYFACDMMIRGIVHYGGGAAPDIECAPNPLTVDMGTGGRDTTVSFYCKNVGAAQLDVTNITRTASWIDTIIPTTFSVPAAGSVQVMITIDTTQVLRDETYEDTLLITSNDPDENPYGEVVILIVPGVEEKPELETTPLTSFVRCCPNPTSNTASIRFAIPHKANISIDVYDVSGKKVSTVVNGEFESGVHNIFWNRKTEKGIRVPQGIYFIRLKSEGIKANTKLIVID